MRPLLSCVLLLLLVALPFGAPLAGELPEQWRVEIDGPAGTNDFGYAVAVDGQGNVVVAGTTRAETGSSMAVSKRYRIGGGQVFTEELGTSFQGTSGYAVAVDAANHVFVAGSLYSDFAVVKLHGDTGEELWSERVTGSRQSSSDVAFALVLDSQGDAIAAGQLENEETGSDFVVIKFDGATGDEEWRYVFDGSLVGDSNDRARAVTVDPFDDVLAVGRAESTDDGIDWYAVKLSGVNGARAWHRVIDGTRTGRTEDQAAAVAAAPDGDALVAGKLSNADSGGDFAVFRLAASNGATRWDAQLDGSFGASDAAEAVTVDEEGNAIAAGRIDRLHTRSDFAVVKLAAANGATLWDYAVDGGAGNLDTARAVAYDWRHRRVVAAGDLQAVATGRDAAIVSLRATDGRRLGSFREDGAKADELVGDTFEAVAFDDEDSVAVGRLENDSSDLFLVRVPEPSTGLLRAAMGVVLLALGRRAGPASARMEAT